MFICLLMNLRFTTNLHTGESWIESLWPLRRLLTLIFVSLSALNINDIKAWEETTSTKNHLLKMTSSVENAGIRRKSSSIATLMTLNCNLPNIPIINEPTSEKTAAEVKKKAIRFDTNITSEYDSEEIRENKRKITDEMKSLWVQHEHFLLIYFTIKKRARGDFEFCWKFEWKRDGK